MKALVLGATGAVGRDLVALLLADPAFDSVEVFVRREPGVSSPKLVTHVVDFDRPDNWQQLVRGDVAFSCLGTTLKAAGSQAAQYKVDYTYQYNFAKAAARNGVPAYLLVSSAHADAHSRLFYPRLKGSLDDAVRQLPFAHLCIVRPPALVRKGTDRLSERLSLPFLRFLNRLGLFKSQAPMDTLTVAKAMVRLAKQPAGHTVVEAQELREWAVE